jgi:hypothetical protein
MTDLTTLANVKAYLGMQGVAIQAITKANPGVVTAANHNLKSGLPALISGALGMTQINGVPFVVTVIDPATFSIGLDTSTFGAYTGGAFVGQDDPLLARMITALSAWASVYCSRNFPSAAYDEFYNGAGLGHSKLVLRNYPIISIQSVTMDGTLIVPSSPAPSVPGYVADEFTLYLRGFLFSPGFQNVEVKYTAGFATIPPDLEQSVIGLVAWRYRESKRIGETAQSLGGQITTSFALKDMPPEVLTGLQQYKKSVSV